VAEITDRLELTGWPEGTRVIVRRERPHPGAQLSFTDHDGHRFLATLTDLEGDAVELERPHRARATTEDRVRAAKQTGLENLPFGDFDHNAVWLELSLIAQDLTAWTSDSRSTASSPPASPRRCATDCCTQPPGSPSTPAARPCACSAPGPGPTPSPPRSRASPRCHHPRAERTPATTTTTDAAAGRDRRASTPPSTAAHTRKRFRGSAPDPPTRAARTPPHRNAARPEGQLTLKRLLHDPG
jgi:Transposase DDE domain group 1